MPLLSLVKMMFGLLNIAENLVTLQSSIQNWLSKLSTNMVISQFTFNLQTCMIYHLNQNVTADAKRYDTCLYVECTTIYDHICTHFWRSVSASGHGNTVSNKLPRPSRVRSRPPQRCSLFCSAPQDVENTIPW